MDRKYDDYVAFQPSYFVLRVYLQRFCSICFFAYVVFPSTQCVNIRKASLFELLEGSGWVQEMLASVNCRINLQ